jgi:hypothetical protein
MDEFQKLMITLIILTMLNVFACMIHNNALEYNNNLLIIQNHKNALKKEHCNKGVKSGA